MQFNISFQHSMNVANVTVIKIFKKALTLFFFWQKFNFANCCFLLSRIIFFFCNFARVYFRELAFFQNFCEYMFSWIAVCQSFREVLFSWIIPKFTKLLLGKMNHLKASVVGFLFLEMLLCYLIFVFYYQLCGSILEKKRLVLYHSFFS